MDNDLTAMPAGITLFLTNSTTRFSSLSCGYVMSTPKNGWPVLPLIRS